MLFLSLRNKKIPYCGWPINSTFKVLKISLVVWKKGNYLFFTPSPFHFCSKPIVLIAVQFQTYERLWVCYSKISSFHHLSIRQKQIWFTTIEFFKQQALVRYRHAHNWDQQLNTIVLIYLFIVLQQLLIFTTTYYWVLISL